LSASGRLRSDTHPSVQSGRSAITDLGIAILEKPVKDIRPAQFSLVDALERDRSDDLPLPVVGYGVPVPPPPGQPVDFSIWDGLRKIRYSKVIGILNDGWGSWELPSSVCYGDSGGPTLLRGPFLKPRLAAVSSDGGPDCISTDIRVRVDTHAARQWIRTTIWRELREDMQFDER
jgi:hypothetical protein